DRHGVPAARQGAAAPGRGRAGRPARAGARLDAGGAYRRAGARVAGLPGDRRQAAGAGRHRPQVLEADSRGVRRGVTDCLFCKIARGEIPATVVRREGRLVAFRDIAPQAPTHLLVIPAAHVASLNEATDAGLLGEMMALARDL